MNVSLQSKVALIADGRIAAIYITRNPDKLRQIEKSLDARGPAR